MCAGHDHECVYLLADVSLCLPLLQGAISMQLQCMELAPLVAQLVQAYSPLAKPGVALSSSVPPGTAVLADPNRLRQALSHVLDNACKFTLQGTIQVSAHAAPAAGSSSSSDADGSGADEVVTISVADTGVGIPAAQLPHVWKLFRQADMGPARQHCGAGLGLCLVRGLVEALGGKVEVVSKEGSGTSCHMRVPGWRAPVASSQAAAQQAQQGAPAGASASVEVSGLPVGSALEPRGLYHHAASSMRHSSSSNALAAMLASSAAATAAPSALGCGGDVPAASGLRSPKASSSGLGSLSKGTYREKHGRVQVLCVDDDAISQLVVKRLLGPSGEDSGWCYPWCSSQDACLCLCCILSAASCFICSKCMHHTHIPSLFPARLSAYLSHTHMPRPACRLPHRAGHVRPRRAGLPGGVGLLP